MDEAALDAALRRLHGRGDRAARLSRLHEASAALPAEPAERRFRLTQAWVFALEAGEEARVARLEAELRRLGGF